jgi:hypothetical protein
MVVLAEPDPEDMVRAVRKAIDILPGIDPQTMHLRVSFDYTWLRALLHIAPLSEMGILHQLFFLQYKLHMQVVSCLFKSNVHRR